MSKRQIVVEIDCEDERCGECEYLKSNERKFCDPRRDPSAEPARYGGPPVKVDYLRGPLCLQAESKLRALVRAGTEMREYMGDGYALDDAWDVALAALKGGA